MRKTTKNDPTNKAIGYARVSTQEQVNEGVSLQAQEERITAYCAMRGLDLVEVVREEGVSGGTPFGTRPQGSRVMEAVANRTVSSIIVCKLDRGFRDACDCLSVTKSWDKADVALHVIDMGGMSLDTRSAMGRMFLTLVAAFAELEKNLIGERTSAALQHLSDHGVTLGAMPLGQARTDAVNEEGYRVVAPVAEEAETVQRIRELRSQGLTLRAIASKLTAEGRATKKGGKWGAETVRLVLARCA